jgi:hypothetical protein
LAWLEANRPALLQNVRQEISNRLGRQQDADTFLESLRKVGLQIGS